MQYQVIGVMSGTSMDGIDIAHCVFEKKDVHWHYKITNAETHSYSNEWIEKLSSAHLYNANALIELDRAFGNYIGAVVGQFMARHNLTADLIVSHGHTIFHNPSKGITYQIGYGANIYAHIKLPVVFDFRTLDIALGGQGAPLVPIGDQLLFEQHDACLNLGGFANISFEHQGKRIAYDISPCNIVLNELAGKLGKAYDDSGDMAKSGKPDKTLLQKLNALSYYQQSYPKSLGREWVAENISPIMQQSPVSTNDKLTTFTHHVAEQIAKSLQHKKNVLITGGGTFNAYLITLIRTQTNCEITIPDSLLINYKEALIFALLGLLKLRNEINTLSSVTGASRDSSGGVIFNG